MLRTHVVLPVGRLSVSSGGVGGVAGSCCCYCHCWGRDCNRCIRRCSCCCFLSADCCCGSSFCCCNCACWGGAASRSGAELLLFDPGDPPSLLPFTFTPLRICLALVPCWSAGSLLLWHILDGGKWLAGEVKVLHSAERIKNQLSPAAAATHFMDCDSMWEAAGSMEGVALEAVADPRQVGLLQAPLLL